jgi:hypothetical protein
VHCASRGLVQMGVKTIRDTVVVVVAMVVVVVVMIGPCSTHSAASSMRQKSALVGWRVQALCVSRGSMPRWEGRYLHRGTHATPQ